MSERFGNTTLDCVRGKRHGVVRDIIKARSSALPVLNCDDMLAPHAL